MVMVVVCGLEVKCVRVRKDEVGFLEGWRWGGRKGQKVMEAVGLLVAQAVKAQPGASTWLGHRERKTGHQ